MSEPQPALRPLIGLTAYVDHAKMAIWEEDCAFTPVGYVSAVIRAGGTPVLLPPSPSDAAAVLEPLSGLILTGGPDVDPARYDAPRHPVTEDSHPDRDTWEMALAETALDEDLPLLAICRGVQLLNVTLGGTLHQNVPEVVHNCNHQIAIGQMNRNTFSVEAGSTLAGILGTETDGLCHHHQAVDRLGRRARAIAFAPDGLVEGIEISGQEFAIGVQWHPEDDPSDDRIFAALVEAARIYHADVMSGS